MNPDLLQFITWLDWCFYAYKPQLAVCIALGTITWICRCLIIPDKLPTFIEWVIWTVSHNKRKLLTYLGVSVVGWLIICYFTQGGFAVG
jgi:hypothetical protein